MNLEEILFHINALTPDPVERKIINHKRQEVKEGPHMNCEIKIFSGVQYFLLAMTLFSLESSFGG